MRIMWWSNAPWVATGYGVQTRLFVPRLISAGHDVAITTNAGLNVGTITWEGIRVFAGSGPAGSEVVGWHSRSWEADITISLFDAWVVQPALFANTGMRWVPWFPVDSEPPQPLVLGAVRQASHSIVFSRFGERLCTRAGITPYYVPHGVDCSVYKPMDRREARRALGCPEGAFLLGMVAVNRGFPSRKSIPQVLQAFARFRERHPEAYLYLHTTTGEEPWRESIAMPLAPLLEHLGIKRHVIVAEPYNMLLGFPDEYMTSVYNALDGLVAPSMGEGFGVPILEAQACGCPVIVGDWTSMSELCFAGYKVPREEGEFYWTDLQGGQIWPHAAAVLRGMEHLWERRGDAALRERARAGASAYDLDRVVREYWTPTLEDIEHRIRGNPARNRKAQLLLRLLSDAPEGAVCEVGCARHEIEIPSDGFSTAYLSQACVEAKRAFFSCDLDPVAVDVANAMLARRGLPTRVVVADGLEVLRSAGPLALLYLDSSDDPRDTEAQLAAAEILPGGIVVIDDAQMTGRNAMGKATLVGDYFARRGLPLEIVQTEPGFAAMVLRFPDGKLGLTMP